MILLDTHAFVWLADGPERLSEPAAFPGERADRIIYATALERGTRLVSRDAGIAAFDRARVLW